jgi:diphosphomevalonate decarboxylase
MKSTAIANSNIAFIKYWGKKDEKLNIPMNPSISMTLDSSLSTKTTVEFSKRYPKDEFILNDKRQGSEKLQRVSVFLDIVRKRARSNLKAKIVSKNTFPTGSGIASSASGFAALAAASSKAMSLNYSKKELSMLARQGSGSASRSIYGGFVEWDDSYATQIKDEIFWPELRDIILIVSDKEKSVSSRDAMKQTVEKSSLYKKRIEKIPEKIKNTKTAIQKKDFQSLAKLIMEDSDDMHSCIEETGINYLAEDSLKIKDIIRDLNKDSIIAAYSFDAGPNAHIITLEKNIPLIIKEIQKFNYLSIISKPGKGISYTKAHLF